MAGIRGADTKPELILRRGLHKRGFRYRLHDRSLPGRPDMVFPGHNAVLFADGCFWHGHDCHLFKWPKSRKEFWREKIGGNIERDRRNEQALLDAGWRVARVWECALKGKTRRPVDSVIGDCATWIRSDTPQLEIAGYE